MNAESGADPLRSYVHSPVGRVVAIERRRAGLTGSELAARAGMSQSKISRIETGRATPTDDEISRLVDALGLPAEAGRQLLGQVSRQQVAPDLLPPRPDDLATRQREAADIESSARSMRVFTPNLVAGLLQTSEYARAVLASLYRLLATDGAEPEDAVVLGSVAKRLDRQRVLAQSERRFHFVMQESALSNGICPPAQMLVQLQRIREVIQQHDNVTVALLQSDVSPPPGSPNFIIYDNEYVVLDLPHVSDVLTDTVNISVYQRLFDRIDEMSTTDIDPILDKYIDMYYELARPRRD